MRYSAPRATSNPLLARNQVGCAFTIVFTLSVELPVRGGLLNDWLIFFLFVLFLESDVKVSKKEERDGISIPYS
jgi:hypothetical protein